MKKLLFASLILLAGCKKETPEPAPNNPSPAVVHENYVIASGDTFQFPHVLSGAVAGDSITISGFDTTGYYQTSQINQSITFSNVHLALGTDTLSYTSNDGVFLNLGMTAYDVGVLSFTISEIGPPGGYVSGYYSGTMKIGLPPTTVILVSGKFSVTRN